MATKSITIKESAYEILKSRKKENESFSDLIERIGGRRPLIGLAEVTSREEGENIAEEVKETRKEIEEEMEERSQEIEEALK
jgi:predicted CopG family antitoxin